MPTSEPCAIAPRVARTRAFSLLEIMVAIAILGLTLTVILSAQGSLSASDKIAAREGMAVTLARCKMTAVEEDLLKRGYPVLDEINGDEPCCEGIDAPAFSCDTSVERVELPEMSSGGSEGDGGLGGALAQAVKGTQPESSGDKAGAAPLPPGLAKEGAIASAVGDGGLNEIAATMNRQTDQASGGSGSSGLVAQVLGIVDPSLRPILSTSVRRVTVSVNWKEGPTEREFTLVQFVSNPTIAAGALGAGGAGAAAAPGAAGGATGGAAGNSSGAVPLGGGAK
jgi:general secretion pathway protein I